MREPVLSLDALSDKVVCHMTADDLAILMYIRGQEADAGAVLEEGRLQERWFRLHPDRRTCR